MVRKTLSVPASYGIGGQLAPGVSTISEKEIREERKQEQIREEKAKRFSIPFLPQREVVPKEVMDVGTQIYKKQKENIKVIDLKLSSVTSKLPEVKGKNWEVTEGVKVRSEISGAVAGFYGYFRERPLSAIASGTTGLVTAVATRRYPSLISSLPGKITASTLAATYATQKATEISLSTSPYKKGYIVGSTAAELTSLGIGVKAAPMVTSIKTYAGKKITSFQTNLAVETSGSVYTRPLKIQTPRTKPTKIQSLQEGLAKEISGGVYKKPTPNIIDLTPKKPTVSQRAVLFSKEKIGRVQESFAKDLSGEVYSGRELKIDYLKTAKSYAGVKLEQFQTNLALETSGGQLVTKGFFKRADIGKAQVTGEAVLGAKGEVRQLTTPYGLLETKTYTPIKEKVTIKFDPRKPPIPDDFLFRGRVKETVEFRELASPTAGVTMPRTLITRDAPIQGFGFGGKLEQAATPFKSIRVLKGETSFVGGRVREFQLEFFGTKLSRSQSLETIIPKTRPTKAASPVLKQLGLKQGKIEVFKFKEAPKSGTLALTETGSIYAPEGVKLNLGGGTIKGFLYVKPRTLTSQQTAARYPVIAKKVKLTPAKQTSQKVEIFVAKDLPTVSGQVLQQFQKVIVLEVPKQKQKQKVAQKQKVTSKQTQAQVNKLEAAIGSKQKQTARPKVTSELKLKSVLKQKVSIVPKLAQLSGLKQLSKQSQKQQPKLIQKLEQVSIQKPKLATVSIQKQIPVQKIRQTQLLIQKTKIDLTSVLKTPRPQPRPRPRPGDPPPIKIKIPKLPAFNFGKMVTGYSKRKTGRQYEFQPSLVALEGMIRGRSPKRLTGLEIRKINY